MPGRRFEQLAEGGFFECPRWHDGRWWVSDFYRNEVVSLLPSGVREWSLSVEGQPGGLGWTPDGTLLVVSMKDRRLLRASPEGSTTEVADLSAVVRFRLNDMVVDGAGRAWIGNYGFDVLAGADPAPADLVRVDPDGTVSTPTGGLEFPNGSVIADGGRTLIVGETIGQRYSAFTVTEEGALVDRRVWADISGAGIAPDGCCLDASGNIWAADVAAQRCVLLAEGGKVVDEVSLDDELRAYACMLGGADGRTLLVCAAPGYRSEHDRAGASPGLLLTTTVEIPRDGLP